MAYFDYSGGLTEEEMEALDSAEAAFLCTGSRDDFDFSDFFGSFDFDDDSEDF